MAALAALLLAGGVAGCGSASPPSPPTGVDGLAIPTPTPNPDDFVEVVDNPWLPLRAGAAWVYDISGATPADTGSQRVEVVPGRKIAGVLTTGLRTVLTRPAQLSVETLDFYAQDEVGNVWWFGRDQVWQAGEEGAEAGLAMAASPRVGDGYLRNSTADGADERAEVIATDGAREVPLSDYDDLLIVDTTLPAPDDPVQRGYYAREVGLVASEVRGSAPDMQLELVAYDEPQQ